MRPRGKIAACPPGHPAVDRHRDIDDLQSRLQKQTGLQENGDIDGRAGAARDPAGAMLADREHDIGKAQRHRDELRGARRLRSRAERGKPADDELNHRRPEPS